VFAVRAQSLSLKKASPQGVKLLCQELAENPLLEWGLLPEFLGVRESTLAIGICSPEYRYWIWEEFNQQDFAELITLKVSVLEKISELKVMKGIEERKLEKKNEEIMISLRDNFQKKRMPCLDPPNVNYNGQYLRLKEMSVDNYFKYYPYSRPYVSQTQVFLPNDMIISNFEHRSIDFTYAYIAQSVLSICFLENLFV
jgi:hypothetical protein